MLNKSTIVNVLNFIVFQLSWFVLILYQETYLYLVLLILMAFFVYSRISKNDALFIAISVFTGVAIDSLLVVIGVLVFDPAPTLLPIPAWLLVIWIAFASTIRHSIAYLGKSLTIAACFGAVAGAASYYAGMHLGAVEFGYSDATVVVIYAAIWALLLPLMFVLSNKIKANIV